MDTEEGNWIVTTSYMPGEPMEWLTRTIAQLRKANHSLKNEQDLYSLPLATLREMLPQLDITITEYGCYYNATDIQEGQQGRYVVLKRGKRFVI